MSGFVNNGDDDVGDDSPFVVELEADLVSVVEVSEVVDKILGFNADEDEYCVDVVLRCGLGEAEDVVTFEFNDVDDEINEDDVELLDSAFEVKSPSVVSE